MNGKVRRKDVERSIRNFDPFQDSIENFLNLVESNWAAASSQFKRKGVNTIYLELHTGGISYNEELIAVLERNFVFWSMYWQKSVRGGHYYFKIVKPKKKKDGSRRKRKA